MESSTSYDPYKMINSPFKWVGGKSRLRKYIVPFIPPHTCFVDLFAGASWVLFGKPDHVSQVEVLNDRDNELINFFRVVKENPEELIESFEWELVARAEFERLASLNPQQLTSVQRAHRFYYLIMAGWGGELAYPRFQTSVTDGGHGNRLFGAIKTLRTRLEPVHRRLSTVIIENLDWQQCLAQYDSAATCMYVDPPYPGNKCNYAHNMRDWASHYHLYDSLRAAQSKWIISSYDIPEVRNIFSGAEYNIVSIQSFSGMKVKKNGTERTRNKEVLVMNFPPPDVQISPDVGQARMLLEKIDTV